MATKEAELHAAIIRHVAEKGFAPPMQVLHRNLGWPQPVLESTLKRLAEIRGVILKPNSLDVWAIHPFSLMPTATWVTAETGAWWANCAWCALGIGAALRQDIRVVSRAGAEDNPLELEIRNGRPSDRLVIHFPFRPHEWWSNPYNPCGAIVFFSSRSEVGAWCTRHGFPLGDVIDIDTGIALARAWFGDYLELTWSRKSAEEAQQVFRSLGLTSEFWHPPPSPGPR
jgi:hypothetical protein